MGHPGLRSPREAGRLDGIAYHLWLPQDAGPVPALVVLHGAGSRKENHADFARAAGDHGFAALTFDNRGHGETEGALGARAVSDIQKLVRMLAERDEIDERRIGVRGSSMGGLLALHAAAASETVSGVIAICPATEDMLLSDVRKVAAGQPPPPGSALESMRLDAPSLVAWLEEHDVRDAVARIAGKPLMLIHAAGDEVVPSAVSEELFERAGEPKRLLITPDGDHRSAQHDAELQGESLRWLARAMRA